MPKDKDLLRPYAAIGINKQVLMHSRNVLLAQQNTAGYSTNDPIHRDPETQTQYRTYSDKAQRSGKTYSSTYADTLRPGRGKYVDTIEVNTPNTLNYPKAKREQEGADTFQQMDKSNLKIAGGLALLGLGLTKMVM